MALMNFIDFSKRVGVETLSDVHKIAELLEEWHQFEKLEFLNDWKDYLDRAVEAEMDDECLKHPFKEWDHADSDYESCAETE